MSNEGLLIGLIGIILGGGGVGAIVPLLRFRTDRDLTIATGSEAAVQSLTTALVRSDARIVHLEQENEKLLSTIVKLRADVDTAQATVRALTYDLAETKRKLDIIFRETKDPKHDK